MFVFVLRVEIDRKDTCFLFVYFHELYFNSRTSRCMFVYELFGK